MPATVPAAIVKGRPSPRSRAGTLNSRRSAGIEILDASEKRTSVSVAWASSLIGSLPSSRSSSPSAGPASRPVEVKKIARVT